MVDHLYNDQCLNSKLFQTNYKIYINIYVYIFFISRRNQQCLFLHSTDAVALNH